MMSNPYPDEHPGELPRLDDVEFPMVEDEARSVMVIDDSLTIRAVVEAGLLRDGYRVSTFPGGLAAMGALARGEVEVPDLVLLDIGMPRMDGYEVARILRAKDEFVNTYFVMMTCHDGVWDRMRAKLVGAVEFIAKPFVMAYLLAVVRRYLRPAWR